MTNTKTQTFSEKLADAFNTLESRGEVIAKEYKALSNAEKHLAKRTNVFDTALGELMFELKCEQDGKRIPTSRLQDCGIHNIPKQRRADALFYVENKAECDSVAESSEKGFTNMNALVKATQKARKADEPKSDNGLSAEQIVEKALDLCDKHSKSVMIRHPSIVLVLCRHGWHHTNRRSVSLTMARLLTFWILYLKCITIIILDTLVKVLYIVRYTLTKSYIGLQHFGD